MKLPKVATGVRYLNSTDYNTLVNFIQPNFGNAADGTPLPPAAIARVWANVSLWRGKQNEKPQLLQAASSYKVVIRYPKTFAIDTGMNILVRGQLMNIESFSDLDGTRTELTIWCWVGNDQVNK
jgi:SPP1 family predicted phage head-tail adaptor